MTSTPELLPCPFCGGKAQISRAHQNKMLAMGEVATDEHYLFTLHHTCNPALNDGVTVCWTYKPKAVLVAAWNRRTPAPVSGDLREVIKRAVLPIIDKVPAVDASQSRIREIRAGWMADAALTALAPHIAAEIAAAREEGRRNERAEVVAYGNPTQFSTWGNQVARFIEAIERGEHTKGEK